MGHVMLAKSGKMLRGHIFCLQIKFTHVHTWPAANAMGGFGQPRDPYANVENQRSKNLQFLVKYM